ncbi:interferon-induced, double-stranded RNA-activated protein kinase isoform X5 [Buteo buteo]|uniref:interferon-induced, double-stranded RNA-activated protein kinase isoform X5 n=1 Tax=Buteo buteo TaxID=30397 RepID=UPI003EB793DC
MDRECMEKINTYCQKQKLTLVYANVRMTGPSHDPEFTVVVKINDVEYGTGTGKNKKEAKAVAAKKTWEMIEKQMGREESNGNSTFTEHSNSSRVPTQSDSDSVSFEDSAAKLVEKMKDMAVCKKPSPSQRDAQSSALKSRRKLAANFDNARNKEEEKKMSDLDESLPDLDTNTSEENESPYTVNKRFLESFKNIEPIGEGGFGNVFKATGKLDERTYAVKRVQFTENVKREVKELARLDHENIVRYYCSWKGYDHVTYSDSRQKSNKEITCLFIQMELCEQGPLENWIEKNRLDRKYHEMAQNKFLQILKGVKYIHSKELIHRDLKPQNIFISHEDKIKIGDFGLVTSVAYGTLTENRGTKSYMAPEQFGDRYGKEVDIYALGLIWFEILSAFSGHEKIKVWHDVREGQLPESFTKQFPVKVWDFNALFQLVYLLIKHNLLTFNFFFQTPIIKKMLSRDPSGRYSASEILEFFKSVDKDNSFKTHTR